MIVAHHTLDLFGKMVFEKATIQPPFQKPNPMPDEACFLYIIEGETSSISEVEEIRAMEKDAILMKCGRFLSKMFPSQLGKKYEAVAVHLYPEVLRKVYEKDPPSFLTNQREPPPERSMVKIKTDELLQKYFDSLLFYFENPELVNEELMILKLKELMLLLEKTRNAPVMHEILSGLFSPKSYSFREIIEAHFYSNLSIEQLAPLTNLSVSSFKREFKRIFNDTPARYMRNEKLKKASNLLLLTDKNISEIAFECGFNDLSGFSNTFKDRYSLSPTDYRLRK